MSVLKTARFAHLLPCFLALFLLGLDDSTASTVTPLFSGSQSLKIRIIFIPGGYTAEQKDVFIGEIKGNLNHLWGGEGIQGIPWFALHREYFDVYTVLDDWSLSNDPDNATVRSYIETIEPQQGFNRTFADALTVKNIHVVICNRPGGDAAQKDGWIRITNQTDGEYTLAHEMGIHVIGTTNYGPPGQPIYDDEYIFDPHCDRAKHTKFVLNIHDRDSNDKWSHKPNGEPLLLGRPYLGAWYCRDTFYRPYDDSIANHPGPGGTNPFGFGELGNLILDIGLSKRLGVAETSEPLFTSTDIVILGVSDKNTYKGTINVRAYPRDTSGIYRVDFYWARAGETSRSLKCDISSHDEDGYGKNDYRVEIDTSRYANGSYYLDIIAWDNNLNYKRVTTLISINNSPPDFSIPLRIRDVAGVDRVNEPVSSGVPLPLGLLYEPRGIAVFDENGTAIPAQFKVLERWREFGQDGSVKWLLITFITTISANSEKLYFLKPGNNPMPQYPASAVDHGSYIRIGGQDFLKDFSSPFKAVLTRPDETQIEASNLSTIQWEILENGPVRSLVKAESSTEAGKFGFIAWIYAYAGQERWDVKFVLKNTPREPRGPFYFKDFSIIWEIAGSQYKLGGSDGDVYTGTLGDKEKISLYQDSSGTDRWDRLGETQDGVGAFILNWTDAWKKGIPQFRGYKVVHSGNVVGNGNHALGWAALDNAFVANRHFWQQNPKAIEIEQNRIIIRLWPIDWKGHGGIHWLDDLQRKAHEISFRLGTFTEKSAISFNYPLVIHCGLDWYRKSGALGYISNRFAEKAPDPKNLGNWEFNWVNFGGNTLDRIRRRYHDYPMDAFIRYGDPYHAYRVQIAMNHSAGMTPMWLDTYNYPGDSRILRSKTYCNPARDPGTYSSDSGHHGYYIWNPEHWAAQELYHGWRLFGDPLALDAIQKMGVYLQFYVDYRITKGNAGETRWDALPMTNLSEIYRITESQSILNSMRQYAALMWSIINKERGYYIPNLSLYPPEGADKPFMISTLTDGLREYYSLTKDKNAFDMIIGLTDYAISEGYVNKCYGFLYETPINPELRDQQLQAALQSDKATKCNSWISIWQMAEPIAWSYLNTGNPKYKQIFDEIVLGAKITTYFNSMIALDSGDWNAFCDLVQEEARDDTVPPNPISDLRAEATDGGIRLTWSLPPEATRYQVKFSERPIVEKISWPEERNSHTNWWAANNIEGEPISIPSGSTAALTIQGLPAGRYYFAVRSFDDSSNMSAISNLAHIDYNKGTKPAPPTNLTISNR